MKVDTYKYFTPYKLGEKMRVSKECNYYHDWLNTPVWIKSIELKDKENLFNMSLILEHDVSYQITEKDYGDCDGWIHSDLEEWYDYEDF